MAELAGAVLTGGASRRMGRDKALLVVDGSAMAVRVATALRGAGADPVLAVGGDLDALRALGLDAVADPDQGAGPLAGITTALGALADAQIVAVLACDLPGATASAVAPVVDALRAAPAAHVAVPVVGGRLQPLHAAWRPGAVTAVRDALRDGRRAVRDVLSVLDVVTVEGLDPGALRNANSPADLGHTGAMTDSSVPEIDVEELARRRADGAYVLDVRQPDEYEAGHVPGAVLIPLDQLGSRQDELPKEQAMLVVCRSGGRSAAAVQALLEAGYDATNVAGGTLAWIESGQPVVEGPEPG